MTGKARETSDRDEPRAPGLADLQAAFQKAVTEGDDAILALIPANSRTSAATLLGVYRHAYKARLASVAAAYYPLLETYLGREQLALLSAAFLEASPSRSPNVRFFADGLPEFLAATAELAVRPEVAELARLERATNDAFDAADAPPASLEDLRRLRPEDWAGLRLTPHSSARRLDFQTNAFDIWAALKDQTSVPAAAMPGELQRLLVWRQDVTARVRALAAEEAMLWDEALRGVSFGALCELAAQFGDPEEAARRVAQHLAGWLENGMLAQPARQAP